MFGQGFKRSFLPDASENPAKKEKVPISSFAKDMVLASTSMWDQDYYETNNIKIEQSDDQEAIENLNIKQEEQG
jgi:hypothetical protein